MVDWREFSVKREKYVYAKQWWVEDRKNHWWPGVTRDIEKYVEGYDMYQRMKNRIEVSVEKLKLSEVSEKLWIYLIVDFITNCY